MNSSPDDYRESVDPREVVRLNFLRVGKLPKLEKGVMVWFLCLGEWRMAQVAGRVPGGVYRIYVVAPECAGKTWFLSCNTFGGEV